MFFLFKHNKLKSNYLSFLHLTAFNHDFTKAVKWKDFMYPAMLFCCFAFIIVVNLIRDTCLSFYVLLNNSQCI